MMMFYAQDLPIPNSLRTDEFLLIPLTSTHAQIDYAALMESNEMLRLWSGTPWPSDDFTLQENVEDLEMHDREHQDREAFTYTVVSPDESECLGCVYITPLARLSEANPELLSDAKVDEAVVGFWVKAPLLDSGLDRRLLAALRSWFWQEWRFSSVHLSTRETNAQQLELFRNAGLRPALSVSVPGRDDAFVLHPNR